MELFPTEILLLIFEPMTPKQLTKCRRVCVRWRDIIDSILSYDDFWRKYCQTDFPVMAKIARYKSKPDLNWYKIYRSLTLWSKLEFAREISSEFTSASASRHEIQDFQVLKESTVAVHSAGGIKYFDISSLQELEEPMIPGSYLKYMENDYSTLFMCPNFHLIILRKVPEKTNITYEDVKMFTLNENHVYYVNMNDELIYCDLNESRLKCMLVNRFPNEIISIGFTNDCLNVLTNDKFIHSIIKGRLVFRSNLANMPNILHEFNVYNLLEQLDWRICYEWMSLLKHAVPQGPLRDISTIRIYGDVVFVGTNWGVFRIYYKPYKNDVLDLFDCKPVKQYNFMEPYEYSVRSQNSIIQIDAIEIDDGHVILIAMPKKMAVLKFFHKF